MGAGVVFCIPCSIGVLIAVSGWLFRCPLLRWIGLALAAISWVIVFIVMFADKTYAEYETREERFLEALSFSIQYLLASIACSVIAVVGIPVAIRGAIGYLCIRKRLSRSQRVDPTY